MEGRGPAGLIMDLVYQAIEVSSNLSTVVKEDHIVSITLISADGRKEVARASCRVCPLTIDGVVIQNDEPKLRLVSSKEGDQA